MIERDWSLAAFTLLSQLAIGTYLVVWLSLRTARSQPGHAAVRPMCLGALLAVGPVMLLGLLLSFLHLGAPLVAWRAASNFASSWLSREITFALAFLALWAVCGLLQWRQLGSTTLQDSVGALTALAGLLMVFSSAMIYLLPNRPSWNSVATPLLFFASTLLLGALAAGAVFAIYALRRGQRWETPDALALVRRALLNVSLVALVVIAVEALTLVSQVVYLARGVAAARETAAQLLGPYAWLFGLQVLVGLAAGFSLTWLARRRLLGAEAGVPARVPGLVFAALACVLAGELIGRLLFYITVVPVRLTGLG
jgi:anaerobic dimethyl sulfoxide reductase subunit C (anchor subunit)